MVMPRLIPCLDVADGRVVKGVRFQGLRDAGDPVERAVRYAEGGADELCLLDVSATIEGRGAQRATVAAVRAEIGIPLLVGGGVRTLDDARALLDAGADKVAVNTAAIARPALVAELAETLGAQCAIVAIDAARRDPEDPAAGFEVVTHGGRTRTGIDAVRWAAECAGLGAGEILATSWDRDGTGEGYDLQLVTELSRASALPVIASGGAKREDDMARALGAGASAVLAATIFHDGERSVADVKRTLRALGIDVRVPALATPSETRTQPPAEAPIQP